jgi:hypothetical protein
VIALLAASAIAFFFEGIVAGAICLALLVMTVLVLYTPLRGWLGLPPRETQEDETEKPKRIGIVADEESAVRTKRTKIRGQDRGVDLRGGSTYEDEDSEIE